MLAEQIEDPNNSKKARRKASNEEDTNRGKNIIVPVQSKPIELTSQGSFDNNENSFTFGIYSQKREFDVMTPNTGFPRAFESARKGSGKEPGCWGGQVHET